MFTSIYQKDDPMKGKVNNCINQPLMCNKVQNFSSWKYLFSQFQGSEVRSSLAGGSGSRVSQEVANYSWVYTQVKIRESAFQQKASVLCHKDVGRQYSICLSHFCTLAAEDLTAPCYRLSKDVYKVNRLGK